MDQSLYFDRELLVFFFPALNNEGETLVQKLKGNSDFSGSHLQHRTENSLVSFLILF